MYTHKYVPYIFLYLFVLRLLLIFFFFFFNDTATTEIYTLSLHDALPISYAEPCQLPPRCIPSVLLSFASAQRVQAQLFGQALLGEGFFRENQGHTVGSFFVLRMVEHRELHDLFEFFDQLYHRLTPQAACAFL